MNFKSILIVGLSIAALGLSLPARAGDTATVIDNQQGATVTGDDNHTNQSVHDKVNNSQHGYGGDTGTSLINGQNTDVMGNGNKTNQEMKNKVTNKQKSHDITSIVCGVQAIGDGNKTNQVFKNRILNKHKSH